MAGDLVSRLPEALQFDDAVESLLEAAPYDDYFHLPDYELVDTLLGIAGRSGLVRARIAVDERRLRHRDEYQELLERDYWYGPTISEAKLDD